MEGLKAKTTLHYVRIPLRLDYFFGTIEDDFRPKIYAGPSVGFLVKADSKFSILKTDVTNEYEPFDLGLSLGTGFNYRIAPSTWLNVDITYTHGMRSIAKNGSDLKNRGMGVAAGIAFGF